MNTNSFVEKIQDYYKAKYTETQLTFVVDWLEDRNDRQRAVLFEYFVVNAETEYGKLPTVNALRRAWAEVWDAYPELRPTSYNAQAATDAKQLTDEHGFTREQGSAYLRQLLGHLEGRCESPELDRTWERNAKKAAAR